jgi:hypothetical protein
MSSSESSNASLGRIVPVPANLSSYLIVDHMSSLQAGPFLVVAKFPRQPTPRPTWEAAALLGLNFLGDNRLRLVLDGTTSSLSGYLAVP